MKMYLKFPIYVKIETECKDRSKVTRVVEEILYPHLKEFLTKARVRSHVVNKIQDSLEFPVELSVQTETEILQNQRTEDNGSTSVV